MAIDPSKEFDLLLKGLLSEADERRDVSAQRALCRLSTLYYKKEG